MTNRTDEMPSGDVGMTSDRTSDRDDRWLASRIRDGEPGAEDELVERYRQPVYAVAAARTRDPEAARDLTQEILMGVLEALREGRLEHDDRLSAFVQGAARNRINTYLANLIRDRARPSLPPSPSASTPEDIYQENERWIFVRRAFDRLKPRDRKILLLTLVDGLKPGEIAERLGISPERLRKQKSRALKRVRDAVAEMSRK
jgi:RNA polymerase sigma factor (sigma-70 family)